MTSEIFCVLERRGASQFMPWILIALENHDSWLFQLNAVLIVLCLAKAEWYIMVLISDLSTVNSQQTSCMCCFLFPRKFEERRVNDSMTPLAPANCGHIQGKPSDAPAKNTCIGHLSNMAEECGWEDGCITAMVPDPDIQVLGPNDSGGGCHRYPPLLFKRHILRCPESPVSWIYDWFTMFTCWNTVIFHHSQHSMVLVFKPPTLPQ